MSKPHRLNVSPTDSVLDVRQCDAWNASISLCSVFPPGLIPATRSVKIIREENMVRAHAAVLFIGLVSVTSLAQSSEKEPAAVLELGGAADRSLTEGQSDFGPTVAIEATPIENKLELEAGVTPLFRRHSTEWALISCSRSHGQSPRRRSS